MSEQTSACYRQGYSVCADHLIGILNNDEGGGPHGVLQRNRNVVLLLPRRLRLRQLLLQREQLRERLQRNGNVRQRSVLHVQLRLPRVRVVQRRFAQLRNQHLLRKHCLVVLEQLLDLLHEHPSRRHRTCSEHRTHGRLHEAGVHLLGAPFPGND